MKHIDGPRTLHDFHDDFCERIAVKIFVHINNCRKNFCSCENKMKCVLFCSFSSSVQGTVPNNTTKGAKLFSAPSVNGDQ